MTREELIKKVALKMDEISSSDDIIVAVNSSDNNPLYTQINDLLNESINDVLTKAPIYRIPSAFIETITDIDGEDDESVYRVVDIFSETRKKLKIRVPDDFIRLASFSDNCFDRAIVDIAIEGDDVDKKQHNRFLVAKNAKPVAVLCRSNDGERNISIYSYSTYDIPEFSFCYVKRFTDASSVESSIELNDYMTDLVSWVCAGRVFAVQGDVNRGKICDENAAALMI